MADGGIHDQLGGGFHRYSTDARWLVPHFEQMLYDNAQLARVYLHAWQVTGDERYRDVATGHARLHRPRADDRRRGLRGQPGRRHRRRGRRDLRLDRRGDPRSPRRCGAARSRRPTASPIRATGKAGRSCSRVASDAELAGRFELTEAEVGRRLGDARRAPAGAAATAGPSRHATARRWRPGTGWRSRPSPMPPSPWPRAIPRPRRRYRTAAERAASAIVDGLLATDGSLSRSWKDGRAVGRGVLEDHAHLAEGLLALYEATFDERWFTTARALIDRVLESVRRPGRRLLRHGR